MIPSAVFVKNRIVSNGMRQLFFVTLLQTPWVSDATAYIILSTSGFTWPVPM